MTRCNYLQNIVELSIINSERNHIKKAFGLILLTFFIHSNIHAQDVESTSWFKKIELKISAFVKQVSDNLWSKPTEKKNIKIGDNLTELLRVSENRLQQVASQEDSIKNEEYIIIAAQIINILYRHSRGIPEFFVGSIYSVQEKKESTVYKQLAYFLSNPTSEDALQQLVQAWKQEPKYIIEFIDTFLDGCQLLISMELDETQCKEVIQEIKNI